LSLTQKLGKLAIYGWTLFGGFLNQTGPDATGAGIDFLNPAVSDRPNTLQIRIKPPFIHIMGMADVVSDQRFFSAYIAFFRHYWFSTGIF